mgnify:CR=1 FL=1
MASTGPKILAILTGFFSILVFYIWCFPVLKEISQESQSRKPNHIAAKKAEAKEGTTGEGSLLFPVGEIIVHIPAGLEEKPHSLGMKLELEFFDESEKDKAKEYLAVVKDSIIQVSLERTFESLNSLAGKYAFKETMVEKINQSFKEVLVKDIHFTAFLLK